MLNSQLYVCQFFLKGHIHGKFLCFSYSFPTCVPWHFYTSCSSTLWDIVDFVHFCSSYLFWHFWPISCKMPYKIAGKEALISFLFSFFFSFSLVVGHSFLLVTQWYIIFPLSVISSSMDIQICFQTGPFTVLLRYDDYSVSSIPLHCMQAIPTAYESKTLQYFWNKMCCLTYIFTTWIGSIINLKAGLFFAAEALNV